ncbi:MAG: carboxypeptidase regulatory-like domain-containing protein [Myxococcales bacterium]|nr:carboxypeptidase regulatory-like domain-containing protein [Myxococcales bacterium]
MRTLIPALVLAGCAGGGPLPPADPPPPAAAASAASAAPASAAPARDDRAEARLLAAGDPVLALGLGAEVGDIWLENPQVVALLAGLDHRLGPSASGGAILHVGLRGATPRARLGAMVPVFDEAGQRAPVFDRVDIMQDGRLGGPAIVRLTGRDPVDDELVLTEEIVLLPDAEGVRLITEAENKSAGYYKGFRFGQLVEWGGLARFVPGELDPRGGRTTSDWVGAAGPDTSLVFAPPVGRVVGVHGQGWSILSPKPVDLTPRSRERAELLLQPGRGGEADAIRQLFAARQTVVGEVSGRVNVPGARVELLDGMGEPVMRGVADAEGLFRLPARPGRLKLRASAPGRAPVVEGPFSLGGGDTVSVPATLGPASSLRFAFDEAGQPLPVRLLVLDAAGRVPDLAVSEGAVRAGDALVSATGRGTLALPPGAYKLLVDAGPAHAQAEVPVQIGVGAEAVVEAALAREMSTEGWFALDPHVEPATGTDGIVVRAVDCAAAGVDAVVLLGDGDLPRDLGRPRLYAGLATADPGVGRFAGLPLTEAVPALPVRDRAAGRLASLAGLPGDPLVAVLRPRSPGWAYFEHFSFDAEAAALPRGFSLDFQLLEVAVPGGRPAVEHALADYLGLLKRGQRVVPLGGSGVRDRGGRCGVARTWLPGRPDGPAALKAALTDGPVVAGFGPILDVTLTAGGRAQVRIRAAAAHRPDVVRVFADGRLAELKALPGKGPLDTEVTLRVPADACAVVATVDRRTANAELDAFAVTSAQAVPEASCPP